MKTFLELVLAGEVQREDIEDFIDQWNEGLRAYHSGPYSRHAA